MNTIYISRYLHEICSPPSVHKNIKSSNILLDTDLNPRLSDCGLASFHQVFLVFVFQALYSYFLFFTASGILIWSFNIPRKEKDKKVEQFFFCLLCCMHILFLATSLVDIGLCFVLKVCFIILISSYTANSRKLG